MFTEADLRKHLEAFAATISSQPLGLVQHCPEDWAQQTQCFVNAMRKVQLDGGKVQFGWMFQSRRVASLPAPGYLIAVHHAVWHSPDGHLVDITPFHSDAKHHPLAPGGDVLFLVDNLAVPVTTERLIAPLPSRFSPLSDDEPLMKHVQQLQLEEEEKCRQILRQ